MKKHELHLAVGSAFEKITEHLPELKLELDEACDNSTETKKHLPFFLSDNAHNDTEITNVDLMIVKDNKVKLICEIEESDVKPIRTFGKVFVAIASISCKLKDGKKYLVDNDGIFIQVLSKTGLKPNTKKIEQGKNIEKAINAILKSNCSWIKEYHLFYGDGDDFNLKKDGYNFIDDVIKKCSKI